MWTGCFIHFIFFSFLILTYLPTHTFYFSSFDRYPNNFLSVFWNPYYIILSIFWYPISFYFPSFLVRKPFYFPGERLGLMQSLAGLAAVLQTCSVEPGKTTLRHPIPDPTCTIVQSIRGGLPLALVARNKWIGKMNIERVKVHLKKCCDIYICVMKRIDSAWWSTYPDWL